MSDNVVKIFYSATLYHVTQWHLVSFDGGRAILILNSQSMLRCTLSKCDDEEFVYDKRIRRRPSSDGTQREHRLNVPIRVITQLSF